MIAAAPNLWWLMRVELFLATAILTLVLASGAIGRARSNAIPWLDLTLMTLTLMLGLHLSGWNAYGIGFLRSYAGDSLSMVFKTLLILCTIFSVWLAKKDDGWAGQRGAFFCALTLCGLLGMFFLVSSLDFLVFFLALELTGLSLYLLTAYSRKNPRSSEAGIKYLILGALSAALFVLGLALVIASTHS
ncbi:MAG: proton-conducting transporter membrane subunit, partial [Candidatus Omnitrophota bacterium]